MMRMKPIRIGPVLRGNTLRHIGFINDGNTTVEDDGNDPSPKLN
jgi:hypothetical protein